MAKWMLERGLLTAAQKAHRKGFAGKFEKEIDVNWIICEAGDQGANRELILWTGRI
jgi:hypothetical protein